MRDTALAEENSALYGTPAVRDKKAVLIGVHCSQSSWRRWMPTWRISRTRWAVRRRFGRLLQSGFVPRAIF